MAHQKPENDDLSARIAAAQAKLAEQNKPKAGSSATSGYGQGMKMVFDLIGGVLVGLLFGLAFDHVFGTRPWGLLVLLGLGLAAGLRLMLRTAQQQAKRINDELGGSAANAEPAKKE